MSMSPREFSYREDCRRYYYFDWMPKIRKQNEKPKETEKTTKRKEITN
jgi:hypothetical protein